MPVRFRLGLPEDYDEYEYWFWIHQWQSSICGGLQNLRDLVRIQFDGPIYGEMAELANALVLKTRDRKVMGDRDPLSPPYFFFNQPPLHMNVILIYYGCCEWKATNDVLWQLGVDLDFSKVLACSHCMTCLGLRCFILSQGNANCDENHSQAHFQMESMTEETLERDVVVYVRGYCWVVARVGY